MFYLCGLEHRVLFRDGAEPGLHVADSIPVSWFERKVVRLLDAARLKLPLLPLHLSFSNNDDNDGIGGWILGEFVEWAIAVYYPPRDPGVYPCRAATCEKVFQGPSFLSRHYLTKHASSPISHSSPSPNDSNRSPMDLFGRLWKAFLGMLAWERVGECLPHGMFPPFSPKHATPSLLSSSKHHPPLQNPGYYEGSSKVGYGRGAETAITPRGRKSLKPYVDLDAQSAISSSAQPPNPSAANCEGEADALEYEEKE